MTQNGEHPGISFKATCGVDRVNKEENADIRRKEIFKIHTQGWTPKPSDRFLEELAEKCVGYCGADIKSLCAEAALCALRRRYPQIHKSSEKLQLDTAAITITAKDFVTAMQKTVPASQRAVASPGRALSPISKPLSENTLARVLQALQRVFPYAELTARNAYYQPTSCKPLFLIVGEPGYGQTSHLASALIHALEKFPVYTLDLSVLFVSITSPETCAQIKEWFLKGYEVFKVELPDDEARRMFFEDFALNKAAKLPASKPKADAWVHCVAHGTRSQAEEQVRGVNEAMEIVGESVFVDYRDLKEMKTEIGAFSYAQ